MLSEKDFVALINQHQNIIHKICNVYMDEHADKEDLFQEITLQAWKSVSNFRGEAQFSTWLYRVALNTAITFLKKGKRHQNTSYTGNFPELTEQPNTVEEQVQAMYKAIAALSKIDKALVMLYIDDYSYREMSDILGITVTNVGAKMNRIKAKLKEEAQKYYHPIN